MDFDLTVLGHGPHRVIWLHGWFGAARGWGPLMAHLNRTACSHVCMDYRGYGARRDEAGAYTMAEIASDALALADKLGWSRFSLVGHSMGGMAVQRVLAEAPERVQKLVAIAPVPASGVPFDEAGWGFFSRAAAEPEVRKAIIDLTTGNRLTSVWLDEMAAFSVATSVPDAFAAYLTAWAKTDFEARVHGLPNPVLAIVGEHDPALSAAVVHDTYLKTYPNARMEVMANAGHYPMFETPVALATTIDRFLAE